VRANTSPEAPERSMVASGRCRPLLLEHLAEAHAAKTCLADFTGRFVHSDRNAVYESNSSLILGSLPGGQL
jgi:hypothetical protein